MRKFLLGLAVIAIVAAACAPEDDTTDEPTDGGTTEPAPVDAATLRRRRGARERRHPHRRHRQSGVPAVVGRRRRPRRTTTGSSTTRTCSRGSRVRRSGAVRRATRVHPPTRSSSCRCPFNKSFAPGPKDFDFVVQQISYSDKRAEAVDFSESYYDVNQALVSRRRARRSTARRRSPSCRTPSSVPRSGTTSLDVHRADHPAHRGAGRLRRPRRRRAGPEERPDRRHRRRPADRVLRDGRADPQGRRSWGSSRPSASRSTSRSRSRRTAPFVECVDLALQALKDDGTLDDDPAGVARGQRDRRPSSRADRQER